MPTLMGIIFDSYNEVYIDESACVNKFQLRKVKEEWKKFDPKEWDTFHTETFGCWQARS